MVFQDGSDCRQTDAFIRTCYQYTFDSPILLFVDGGTGRHE